MDRTATHHDEAATVVQPSGTEFPADVLVVEDEHVSRKALTTLLASSGFHPKAFGSAEDALRQVDDQSPAIALVDVDLPGMSGLDFVDKLEKLCPHVRAVLITAAAGERIDRFMQNHAVMYLRKPLNYPQLLQLLRLLYPSDCRSAS